jgi:hypothetical protein
MRRLAAYNARLRRFDAALRIHWSARRGRFLLERRAAYARLSIDPELYGREEHDTVRQLRDGYHEIGSYLPTDFPSVGRLIAYLKTQDVWQRGDQDLGKLAEAVADELDADYYRRAAAVERAHTEDVGERSGELWEARQWQQGNRVSVPRSLPG